MPDDLKPEGTPSPESAPSPEAQKPPQPPPAEAAPAAAADSPPAPPKPAAPPAAKPAAAAAAAKPPAAPKAPAVMAATPWDSDLTASLAAEFGDAGLEFLTYLGQPFITAKPEAAVPIIQFLKDSHGFDYLVDVTAVHWPERQEQFDVIYVLYSFSRNERVRLKVKIQQGFKPLTATIVHPTADWLEREVFDMFGVEFEEHPNMTRILLPDGWETFPLRKDNNILKMDQRWVQENLGIESGQ